MEAYFSGHQLTADNLRIVNQCLQHRLEYVRVCVTDTAVPTVANTVCTSVCLSVCSVTTLAFFSSIYISIVLVHELQIGFQDVAFPAILSCSLHRMPSTCVRNVVCCWQVHATCESIKCK